MSVHLDLDGLCDVLAGEGGRAQRVHVATCPECARALAELEQAQEPVRAALAALPPPEVPADLAARLDAALLQAREHELVHAGSVPLQRSASRSPSWLVGSAAAVVVAAAVAGGAVGLSRLSGSSDDSTSASSGSAASTASSAAAPAAPVALVSSSTGTDYAAGRAALAAALPLLLQGARTAPRTAAGEQDADPLARLHTAAGLADCLAGLADEAASAVPVALDYARYAGAPALVVVLADPRPDLFDVFVVGAECRAGARHTLLSAALPRAS